MKPKLCFFLFTMFLCSRFHVKDNRNDGEHTKKRTKYDDNVEMEIEKREYKKRIKFFLLSIAQIFILITS